MSAGCLPDKPLDGDCQFKEPTLGSTSWYYNFSLSWKNVNSSYMFTIQHNLFKIMNI